MSIISRHVNLLSGNTNTIQTHKTPLDANEDVDTEGESHETKQAVRECVHSSQNARRKQNTKSASISSENVETSTHFGTTVTDISNYTQRFKNWLITAAASSYLSDQTSVSLCPASTLKRKSFSLSNGAVSISRCRPEWYDLTDTELLRKRKKTDVGWFELLCRNLPRETDKPRETTGRLADVLAEIHRSHLSDTRYKLFRSSQPVQYQPFCMPLHFQWE